VAAEARGTPEARRSERPRTFQGSYRDRANNDLSDVYEGAGVEPTDEDRDDLLSAVGPHAEAEEPEEDEEAEVDPDAEEDESFAQCHGDEGIEAPTEADNDAWLAQCNRDQRDPDLRGAGLELFDQRHPFHPEQYATTGICKCVCDILYTDKESYRVVVPPNTVLDVHGLPFNMRAFSGRDKTVGYTHYLLGESDLAALDTGAAQALEMPDSAGLFTGAILCHILAVFERSRAVNPSTVHNMNPMLFSMYGGQYRSLGLGIAYVLVSVPGKTLEQGFMLCPAFTDRVMGSRITPGPWARIKHGTGAAVTILGFYQLRLSDPFIHGWIRESKAPGFGGFVRTTIKFLEVFSKVRGTSGGHMIKQRSIPGTKAAVVYLALFVPSQPAKTLFLTLSAPPRYPDRLRGRLDHLEEFQAEMPVNPKAISKRWGVGVDRLQRMPVFDADRTELDAVATDLVAGYREATTNLRGRDWEFCPTMDAFLRVTGARNRTGLCEEFNRLYARFASVLGANNGVFVHTSGVMMAESRPDFAFSDLSKVIPEAASLKLGRAQGPIVAGVARKAADAILGSMPYYARMDMPVAAIGSCTRANGVVNPDALLRKFGRVLPSAANTLLYAANMEGFTWAVRRSVDRGPTLDVLCLILNQSDMMGVFVEAMENRMHEADKAACHSAVTEVCALPTWIHSALFRDCAAAFVGGIRLYRSTNHSFMYGTRVSLMAGRDAAGTFKMPGPDWDSRAHLFSYKTWNASAPDMVGPFGLPIPGDELWPGTLYMLEAPGAAYLYQQGADQSEPDYEFLQIPARPSFVSCLSELDMSTDVQHPFEDDAIVDVDGEPRPVRLYQAPAFVLAIHLLAQNFAGVFRDANAVGVAIMRSDKALMLLAGWCLAISDRPEGYAQHLTTIGRVVAHIMRREAFAVLSLDLPARMLYALANGPLIGAADMTQPEKDALIPDPQALHNGPPAAILEAVQRMEYAFDALVASPEEAVAVYQKEMLADRAYLELFSMAFEDVPDALAKRVAHDSLKGVVGFPG